MDICLTESPNGVIITPSSIHGMLWLQTHFETTHWDSISKSQVLIQKDDAKFLSQDAETAGIVVTFIPSFANSKKFY